MDTHYFEIIHRGNFVPRGCITTYRTWRVRSSDQLLKYLAQESISVWSYLTMTYVAQESISVWSYLTMTYVTHESISVWSYLTMTYVTHESISVWSYLTMTYVTQESISVWSYLTMAYVTQESISACNPWLLSFFYSITFVVQTLFICILSFL